MRLSEFNVGDKVRYTEGEGPADLHSEVRYIGESLVVLRNSYGEEFTRESDADGFDFYQPAPTMEELKNLGDDLVASIDNADPGYLRSRTLHMKNAVNAWKARVSYV